MSIVKAFNEHFDEFVSDVERAFPDDTDIATAHTALTALRKSNPKLILTTYRDWVATPYKSQIEVGDIGFFVNSTEPSNTASVLSELRGARLVNPLSPFLLILLLLLLINDSNW